MGGGILQLAAIGIDTVYLMGHPDITLFKMVYRRHTNFSITQYNTTLYNITKYNSIGKYKLEKKADAISQMTLQIEIGEFDLVYEQPTVKNITTILAKYSIVWPNQYPATTLISSLIYNNNIKPIIYNAINTDITIYNNNIQLQTDISGGITDYILYNETIQNQNQKYINSILNNISIQYIYTDVSGTYDSSYLIETLRLLLNNIQIYLNILIYKNVLIDVSNNIVKGNSNGTFNEDVQVNLNMILQIFNPNYLTNLSYLNAYIRYLFEKGYGLYSINANANYEPLDINQKRIQRKSYTYSIDNSGNYIQGQPIRLSNLVGNEPVIMIFFDIIKSYLTDVDISGTLVNPINIRDLMYDSYLNYQTNLYPPQPNPSIFQIHMSNIFGLYILLQQTKIPTVIGFLDWNIQDYYTSLFNTIYSNQYYPILITSQTSPTLDGQPNSYKNFDSYIFTNTYLASLPNTTTIIYNEQSIIATTSNIISYVYNNILYNYDVFNTIIKVIQNANFDNSEHYRFATYFTYTKYVSTYQLDSLFFNILYPSTFGLSDNFIDNITAITQTSNYFITQLTAFNTNYLFSLIKDIENTIFTDYFNDFTLWNFLLLQDASGNPTTFGSLLKNIPYQLSTVYDIINNNSISNTMKKLGILNFLPLYLCNDIPNAINANIYDISGIDASGFALLDLSSNLYTSPYLSIPNLYQKLVSNIILSNGILMDNDFITAFATNYLIDSNKVSLIRLLRPEKSYPFITLMPSPSNPNIEELRVVYLPNTRAVVEEYRREYYRIIQTLSIAPSTRELLLETIMLILDNYIRFDFDISFDTNNLNASSYSTYKFNKYTYPSNIFLLSNPTVPLSNPTLKPKSNNLTSFIYAQASIYGSIGRDNTTYINTIMNNVGINQQLYRNNLGLLMYDLYINFINTYSSLQVVDVSGYEYFSKDGSANLLQYSNSVLYPRITIGYNSFTTTTFNISYNIYNQIGANITVPVIAGFDYNDLQNATDPIYIASQNFIQLSNQMQTQYLSLNANYPKLNTLLSMYNVYTPIEKFNTVETTVNYYNSLISPYIINSICTGPINEYITVDDIYNINILLATTKTNLIASYKIAGDIILSTYADPNNNLNIQNWSIKDLLNKMNSLTNPFDPNLYPNLYQTYIYSKDIYINLTYINSSSVIVYYNSNILDIIINLYESPLKASLYNNFISNSNVYDFIINYLIANTTGSYLLNYSLLNISNYNDYVIQYLVNLNSTLYTQISDIVYYSGPLPKNIPLVYRNQNLTVYYPIQNLVPNILLYEQSNLDVLLSGIILQQPPPYSWVTELGHYFCEYIRILVNGDQIDSFNSNLYSLYNKLYNSPSHKRGYNIQIGNTPDMYSYNTYNKSNKILLIPLYFWFNKDITNSLPMINILYSDVEIEFKIRPILDLLIIPPYVSFAKEPKIKCTFIIDNVYLEQEERLRIASSKLEFLIERFNYGGIYKYKSSDIQKNFVETKLYFSDPTKYLLWRIKIIAPTQNKLLWNQNSYTYTYYETKTTIDPITLVTYITNYPYNKVIKVVDSVDIKFNGNVRQTGESTYFTSVNPVSRYMGSLYEGEYLYSFGFIPKLLQPSGTANLSSISEMSIKHTFTDEFIRIITQNNLQFEIEYWALSYQILRIMSGFAALAFIQTK
jgi:hypothetical protein